MAVYQETISIKTAGRRDMTDITGPVTDIITDSGINTGLCHIFNVGSTGLISTIEFEPGLQSDFPEILHKLIPPGRHYGHEQAWHDGNSHSHLQASLVGPGIIIPVCSGRPKLGTWQQIFHYEADNKPRQREIVVTVTGE